MIENNAGTMKAFRSFEARIVAVLAVPETSHFRTVPAAELHADLAGLKDDRHYGFTRPAGAREPWYARGTDMRSGRQVSLVSVEELEEVARRLEIAQLEPGWIGANIVVAGVPEFTLLPWGSRLVCGAGAVLVNEGDNAPCRFAGAEIARHVPERPGLDRLFPKAAIHRRGIVASVERAGVIAPGPIVIRVPEQRLWTGGTLL
jgi:hypothetical protein